MRILGSARVRLAACVKWYELGQISQAKAAELAGLSRAEFLDVLRAMGTPAVQASVDELAAEIQ